MIRYTASLLALLILAGCANHMTPEQRYQAQNDALLFMMLNSANRPQPVPFYPITGGASATTNCAASGLYMTCTTR